MCTSTEVGHQSRQSVVIITSVIGTFLTVETNIGVSNQAVCADRSPEERDGSGQRN